MSEAKMHALPRPNWLEGQAAEPAAERVALSIQQGRELARLAVEEVAREIERRASQGRLNRGLSISLPYFDDVRMELRRRDVVVIPRGRVLFVPAFVVLACRREIQRLGDDSSLSETTRAHLVDMLCRLAARFEG